MGKARSLFGLLAQLDWKEILRYAIESRKSSWADNPVREWRNAGDTVFCALLEALRKKGVDPYAACTFEA